MEDGFLVQQGLATPIRGDKGKEAVLDLVPLAGARRKMTHGQDQAGFISEFLQFQFPQAQPPAITPSPIGCNEDRGRLRIEPSPFLTPPATDGGHGKRPRIMIGSDIDKSAVPPDIINAIRIGPRHFGTGKIVPLYLLRLFRWKPLLASIVVITNELFLRGIARYHGTAVRQPSFHRSIDVAELRVTVWMILSLLRLAIALQAVVEVVENLRDLGMADTGCLRRARALAIVRVLLQI